MKFLVIEVIQYWGIHLGFKYKIVLFKMNTLYFVQNVIFRPINTEHKLLCGVNTSESGSRRTGGPLVLPCMVRPGDVDISYVSWYISPCTVRHLLGKKESEDYGSKPQICTDCDSWLVGTIPMPVVKTSRNQVTHVTLLKY